MIFNRLNLGCNVNLTNGEMKSCDTLKDHFNLHGSKIDAADNNELSEEDKEITPIVGGTLNNEEPECFFCGKRSSEEIVLEQCKHCDGIYYCGEAHFEYHRPESICFPFTIKHAPGYGR